MTQKKKTRRAPQPKKNKGNEFKTEYIHYRTGKLMRAKDYGWKAWPF
jgi:hypothetical protein